MTRFKLVLTVTALLAATNLTPAFADSYGNDNSLANNTSATTTTSSSASTYNDLSTSSGEPGYYDWNPFADNRGVYISGSAGGAFPTGNDLENGGSYDLSIGYQFAPMVRAELEGAYRNTDIEGAPGDADTYTAMLNAFWDFKNDTRFTPYIMGGLGWSWQHVDTTGFDGTDNAFVYQLGAGASYNLTQNWALTADYRWVDTSDYDFGFAGGDEDYASHELRAGVRYTF